ncbi:hypothetical protein [Cohnella terricola]|uniref:Uncharacterized protein n=1 Tax=Cohnella terricola TaxID=1289167 RepID=A0A559JKI1_9BACL|nr:hypothetical protein [Cohnella terricola]TVY00375.1 hypothetical protein FPZ45_10070 [Cohnella terricola]
MYEFDDKLPKTTTYWKEKEVFHIKHTSFRVTMEEANAIAELLKLSVRDEDTKAIVIDNREASGVWTQEVNKIWDDVFVEVKDRKPKKYVTLTNSAIGAMQINRMSRGNGIENMVKAFFNDATGEVEAFIEAE